MVHLATEALVVLDGRLEAAAALACLIELGHGETLTAYLHGPRLLLLHHLGLWVHFVKLLALHRWLLKDHGLETALFLRLLALCGERVHGRLLAHLDRSRLCVLHCRHGPESGLETTSVHRLLSGRLARKLDVVQRGIFVVS